MTGDKEAMIDQTDQTVTIENRITGEIEHKQVTTGETEKGTTAKISMTAEEGAGAVTETGVDLANLVLKGQGGTMKTKEGRADKMDLEKDLGSLLEIGQIAEREVMRIITEIGETVGTGITKTGMKGIHLVEIKAGVDMENNQGIDLTNRGMNKQATEGTIAHTMTEAMEPEIAEDSQRKDIEVTEDNQEIGMEIIEDSQRKDIEMTEDNQEIGMEVIEGN